MFVPSFSKEAETPKFRDTVLSSEQVLVAKVEAYAARRVQTRHRHVPFCFPAILQGQHTVFAIVTIVLVGILASCVAMPSQGTLIEYRRTGGFVGFDDRLVVNANGRTILTRKSERYEFTISRDTMDRLMSALNSAEITKLRSEYLPSRKGSDLMEYLVTYRGHQVRTMDTAVPDSLWPVLELLNQIVESGGKP